MVEKERKETEATPRMRRYVFVGVKGVGMTGLATVLKAAGHIVQGSDTHERFFTDRILADLHIPVFSFGDVPLEGVDEVIFSTAYANNHPDLERARTRNIPCVTYADALARFLEDRRTVVVAGTHGKTTTSAMLARILEEAGEDPTAVIGGEVLEWGRTARTGRGSWAVVEGDEYQEKFLAFTPQVLVITNIEYDHSDYFPTLDDYIRAFISLIQKVPKDGAVVISDVASRIPAIRDVLPKGRTHIFSSAYVPLRYIFGAHNYANASAALAASRAMNIPEASSSRALTNFKGTRRRLEYYTESDVAFVIMDDYAHHPTEVRASLAALKGRYPDRERVVVFQPHTYSRTETFLEDFSASFADADVVIVLDIYGSAREETGVVRAEDLVARLTSVHSRVFHAHTLDEAMKIILALPPVRSRVAVTMGAGDVWKVAELLAKEA